MTSDEEDLARQILRWELGRACRRYGRPGLWFEYDAETWPPDEEWLRHIARELGRHPGEVFGWASMPEAAERARAEGR